MRIRLALAALTLGAAPALAQFVPGSTVGLPSTGVPVNPFASNHPSVPPSVAESRERRAPRARSRAMRQQAPRPPGRIPR